MKNQSYAIQNALAVTTAIIYVLCRLLVFPNEFFAIAQSWFHGVEFSRLDVGNLTMSAFIVGLISSTITAWVVGYIFIKVYRSFVK